MKFSIVINTYNADKFLEKVLVSVQNFDEVLICDMHSTDRTLELAKKYNCTVIFHDYAGGIPEPARAYAISQAKHNWILMIDADEVVPPGMKEYLEGRIEANPKLGGIFVTRKNYMFGRFTRASYPNYMMRVFKRETSYWGPTVHSQAKVEGDVEWIPKKRKDLALIHLVNDSMTQFTEKMNRYTDLELLRQHRQDKKYGYGALMFQPMALFFKLFILKGGFLDGMHGFVYAKSTAYYKFLMITKVIESRIDPKEWDEELR